MVDVWCFLLNMGYLWDGDGMDGGWFCDLLVEDILPLLLLHFTLLDRWLDKMLMFLNQSFVRIKFLGWCLL